LVHVTRGKTKYTVAAKSEGTFGDVKGLLQGLCKIRASHQRLIYKGKQREDGETLSGAGAVTSGARMVLMVTEGQHKADEEKEILKEAEQELGGVEERAVKLSSSLEHGMLDATDAAVKIGLCYEAYERLSDNISYLVRQDGGLQGREELEKRLTALRERLEGLQQRYILVKR